MSYEEPSVTDLRRFEARTLIEHVADGLALHAEAVRKGELGTREAQARWLEIQVGNLREALASLPVGVGTDDRGGRK